MLRGLPLPQNRMLRPASSDRVSGTRADLPGMADMRTMPKRCASLGLRSELCHKAPLTAVLRDRGRHVHSHQVHAGRAGLEPPGSPHCPGRGPG